MSERFQSQAYDPHVDRAKNLMWAGVFLVVVGALHLVQGVIALVDDTFATKRTAYLVHMDVTGWGWVHLVVGVLALATGAAIFRRMAWAKPVAITLAGFSILIGFFYLPFNLVVTVLVMVADCLVIGAVAAPGVFERDD
jgi:hypothetical protein